MPIQVDWDNAEQNIVRWDFNGHWTWDDVKEALARSIALRQSVDYASSVILNFENSDSLPMGAVTQMMRGMAALPEKREMVVIAGTGTLLKSLVAIYLKVRRGSKDRVGLVETLKQAREYIAAARQS